MTADRRPLQFASIAEIMPDVDRLLAGHRTVGLWSLGQICEHLATVTNWMLDRPADSPQLDPAQVKGAPEKGEVFATGRLPEGMPLPAMLASPDAVDASEGARRLSRVLTRFQESPPPQAPHRLFGPLSKAEWDRVVCIHCAHHLSFVHPQAA